MPRLRSLRKIMNEIQLFLVIFRGSTRTVVAGAIIQVEQFCKGGTNFKEWGFHLQKSEIVYLYRNSRNNSSKSVTAGPGRVAAPTG